MVLDVNDIKLFLHKTTKAGQSKLVPLFLAVFQASLTFKSKARAYPSGALYGDILCRVDSWSLLANKKSNTNTLAYFVLPSMTNTKKFYSIDTSQINVNK